MLGAVSVAGSTVQGRRCVASQEDLRNLSLSIFNFCGGGGRESGIQLSHFLCAALTADVTVLACCLNEAAEASAMAVFVG